MTAYYNEIDPYAAQWLRNLIAAGHIAPGDVDERSIVDVKPSDLAGYTQCHFFAGIGVWSHALRAAGWPDDREVWTGSCPCQPFSAAGKGGGFDDERHLWPAFFHLIEQRRPQTIFGEQVASKVGLAWLDLVHADLEAAGYALGAVDTCAAGFGAPHIRQRLYFVADSSRARTRRHAGAASSPSGESPGARHPHWEYQAERTCDNCSARELANDESERCREARLGSSRPEKRIGTGGTVGELADADGKRARADAEALHVREFQSCGTGDLGDPSSDGRIKWWPESARQQGRSDASVAGFWSDCDWLPYIDGKARPVEPGTFPLAHGATARVGRLRAYGNAIVAPVAAEFIRAYLEGSALAELL